MRPARKQPALAVSSFSPTSGPVGTHVTINGNGYLDAAHVKFNGSPVDAFNVQSPTKITTTVPAAATKGTITVNGVASAAQFKVTPKITSLSTSSARVGEPVTINGTTFDGATKVLFGTVPDTGFSVNGANTQISAHVPVGATSGPIKVITPNGSTTAAFGVRPTLDPLAVTSGHAGDTITITGQTLKSPTSVTFGSAGAKGTIKSSTATQIVVTVPANGVTGHVTVTTAGGSTQTSNVFHVLPKITSFSPTSGPVGKLVKIKGSGLTGATKVTFGTQDQTTVTVVSATEVDAAVPAGAVTGKLTVTTASEGTSPASTGTFTVTP